MNSKALESLWTEGGALHPDAPAWARIRAEMQNAFPQAFASGSSDELELQLSRAMRLLGELKPGVDGCAVLGHCGGLPPAPDYSRAAQAELAPRMARLDRVVEESVKLFEGMPIWNHPRTMPNVVPPANIAAIVAATLSQAVNPNLIEGEYAWNVALAELESAAMLAKLIGWDSKRAGGVFTFGGSGCYLYGLKYALSRVLPDSRNKGIRTDAKLLVSQQGHYTKLNCADWSGLGMNNIIEIKTDLNSNAMDLRDLEAVLQQLRRERTPVAAVVCTMGTTDANAMDPVAQVRELLDQYPNPEGYGKALLYADAVIGWSWLVFGKYDFAANPLGFREKTLLEIKKNYEAIEPLFHADAVGCDFHKVGWAPYNCSLFMMRDQREYASLLSRPDSDYLQQRTSYNPGLFTLEASRSGSYATAGWATLKFFGYEGFQAILGSILEMQEYLRQLIFEIPSMVCVNEMDTGSVTLFRVYPKTIDAASQYHKELNDPGARDELIRHNRFQGLVADRLWQWYRSGEPVAGIYAPFLGYSTGFRPAAYDSLMTDPQAVIYALKSFPMNVNIDSIAIRTVVDLVQLAADQVDSAPW